MKILLLAVFGLMAIAQWTVPGVMIYNKEKVLLKGKIFHFRTEPIDPSDPFRGRYVSLNFRASDFTAAPVDSSLQNYDEVYVVLEKDKDGFAAIKNVVKQQPAGSMDYVKATISYIDAMGEDTAVLHINYPFTEFYMDEYKAPAAESVYRESNIDSTQKTYAVVKILNGEAAIKDIMINDKPISEVIKEREKK